VPSVRFRLSDDEKQSPRQQHIFTSRQHREPSWRGWPDVNMMVFLDGRGLWTTLGTPAAYREPAAWCHCTEPTSKTSYSPELRWRRSAGSWHREHPRAPWLASLPRYCICEEARWRRARRHSRRQSQRCSFVHVVRRLAFSRLTGCTLSKVCSLWGTARAEESRVLESTACVSPQRSPP